MSNLSNDKMFWITVQDVGRHVPGNLDYGSEPIIMLLPELCNIFQTPLDFVIRNYMLTVASEEWIDSSEKLEIITMQIFKVL
ncbi:114_t:CDS:2, partial [Entrophospora sp. SA101]